MNKVALVTVTYNSQTVINGFMNSLLSQTYSNWHLYVVDSGSNDDTLNEIKKIPHNNQVTILALNENVGFAKGNNIGIKQALQDKCDYLMLINNDVEFDNDFLTLIAHEVYQKEFAILAPKMNYFKPKNKIWAAGGGFIPKNAWAAYHVGENELDLGQFDKDCDCDFVPMCCVAIKSNLFQKIGLLDEKYFIYSEDADWFYRAKLLGYRIRYFHKAILYHKVSSLTGGSTSKIGASFGTRNRVYFICKHFFCKQKYIYLTKYFLGMFISLLTGKYSLKEFCWRFPAFFKGLKLHDQDTLN